MLLKKCSSKVPVGCLSIERSVEESGRARKEREIFPFPVSLTFPLLIIRELEKTCSEILEKRENDGGEGKERVSSLVIE